MVAKPRHGKCDLWTDWLQHFRLLMHVIISVSSFFIASVKIYSAGAAQGWGQFQLSNSKSNSFWPIIIPVPHSSFLSDSKSNFNYFWAIPSPIPITFDQFQIQFQLLWIISMLTCLTWPQLSVKCSRAWRDWERNWEQEGRDQCFKNNGPSAYLFRTCYL